MLCPCDVGPCKRLRFLIDGVTRETEKVQGTGAGAIRKPESEVLGFRARRDSRLAQGDREGFRFAFGLSGQGAAGRDARLTRTDE